MAPRKKSITSLRAFLESLPDDQRIRLIERLGADVVLRAVAEEEHPPGKAKKGKGGGGKGKKPKVRPQKFKGNAKNVIQPLKKKRKFLRDPKGHYAGSARSQ